MSGDTIEKILKLRRLKFNIIEHFAEYLDKEEPSNGLECLEKWISSKEYLKDLEEFRQNQKIEEKLNSVVKELKTMLPLNGVLPSEKIAPPTSGPNADCSPQDTVHVDEFLYDDLDMKELCDSNQIKNKICMDCSSREIMEANVISHSLSRLKLEYVFRVLLPEDCSNKKILDVGSRIGAVLYGAYFYTTATKIYGVEMNKDLSDIQKKITSVFKMDDRITLIHSDILKQEDLLSSCDIIILNNVFEFFMDTEKQVEVWRFLKQALKKGCIIVSIPSIQEALDNLDVYEEFAEWLLPIPAFQQCNEYTFDNDSLLSFHEICLYLIK